MNVRNSLQDQTTVRFSSSITKQNKYSQFLKNKIARAHIETDAMNSGKTQCLGGPLMAPPHATHTQQLTPETPAPAPEGC